MDDDKKKENKHRLLGFESKHKQKSAQDVDLREETMHNLALKHQITDSPKKIRKEKSDNEPTSPDKGEKFKIVKDKIVIPSFLDGF